MILFIKQFQEFIFDLYSNDIEAHTYFESPFNSYYIAHLRLIFHLIDLETLQKSKLEPNFFQEITFKTSKSNILLIQIWEDSWFRHNNLVISRIKSQLQLNQKIAARSCTLVQLTKTQAAIFFNQHHLQGAINASYNLGLLHNQKIVAAMAFSKPRVMVDGPNLYRSYELLRFANATDSNVIGGFGKLLQNFIKQKNAQHIMTYIDLDWGNGAGFKKLGFVQTAITEPILCYIDTLQHQRIYQTKNKSTLKTHTTVMGYNSGSAKLILDLRKF